MNFRFCIRSVQYTLATEFDKVERVEFHFVASVYWTLQSHRSCINEERIVGLAPLSSVIRLSMSMLIKDYTYTVSVIIGLRIAINMLYD